MGAQGTAVIDFGSTPSDEASIAVTGQTGITASSKCEAWFMGSTTADNDETDHLMANIMIRTPCGIPVAGTGFTIYGFCENGLTKGTYNVAWVWN